MTANTSRRKCKATKADGKPCKGDPIDGSEYCFFHDPESRDAHIDAAKRGGTGNQRQTLATVKPWRDVVITATPSPVEVVNLLAQTIDDVRTGEIDVKVANSVGYLAGVMMKAIEQNELSDRLDQIEAALAGRK